MAASEKLTIETPEQIALEFPLASAGSRFLALAIDTLIQIGGFLVIAILAVLANLVRINVAASLGTWAFAMLTVLGFLLYYGYYAAFEALWNGQTPGKRAISLRVMTTAGRPISVYDALLRNLLRIVDQLPGIYTVGLLSLFLTERNQRLGDLAADTVVVHEQVMSRRPIASTAPSRRRGASKLTPQELAVIETFLSRRHALPEEQRRQTAAALAERMRRRLDLAGETSIDDEVLLEEVATEARGM